MNNNRYITFRGTPGHMDKLQRMATMLGTSQSDVLRRLVESAEVQSKPTVSVGLQKNTANAASTLTGSSTTAVGV